MYIVLREDEACNFSSSYLFTSMVNAFFLKMPVFRYYVKLNFLMVFLCAYFCFRSGAFKTGKAIYRRLESKFNAAVLVLLHSVQL